MGQPMPLDYAWDKLHQAIAHLLRGNDILKQRLKWACGVNIALLEDEHFPAELLVRWHAIYRTLHQYDRDGEPLTYATAINGLSLNEAQELAENIWSLYEGVLILRMF